MAEAIVSIVVGRITDLLVEEPQLLHQVRHELQQVSTELMRIKTFLPDADSRIDEDKIRILLREIRELAYDAEHVVETFLVTSTISLVRNCAGLPLAIVILGGILVTKPSLIEWEKVYNDSLPSLKKGKGLGEGQQEQIFDILAWSYNDLPPQLRACFLYLGGFMKDKWIDAENLYQLWIAEGMVLSSDKREGETMMQVAESYMGELVHRSMVQVRYENLESSLTQFESCCLHDLMRDLSLSQGKAEDFFEAIDFPVGNKFHLSMFGHTRRLVVNCTCS